MKRSELRKIIKEELQLHEAHINPSFPRVLTHWDNGNPRLEMPLNDILIALRNKLHMNKKDFPAEKQEYSSYARATGNRGMVLLPDGAKLEWHKSSPPSRYINITSNTPAILQKYKKILDSITDTYDTNAIDSTVQKWNSMPEDVRKIMETFKPSLSAKNLISLRDNSTMMVDYHHSTFDEKDLPSGYKYIPDPKYTNFNVRTPRRLVKLKFHTYQTLMQVEW